MSVLLEYMLKEVTVRDFVALSNPTECKKYVIFMANALHKSFYELQIVPTKDKRGVIAFRPIKELIQSPTEDSDKERQSLCLTLAYFYTRIFQIYGALALTLIDDASVITESGLTSFYGEASKTGLMAPGRRQYVSTGGLRPLEIAGELGNFYFLNTFLFEDKDTYKGFQADYEGSGEHAGEVFFIADALPRDEKTGKPIIGDESGLKVQKGTFRIGYRGASNYAKLEVFAKRESIGSGRVIFKFGKITYYKRGSQEAHDMQIPSDILSQDRIMIVGSSPARGERKLYSIEGSNESIADYFNNVFYKLIPLIKRLSETGYTPTGNTYTTTSSTTVRSEVGTAEELHLARLLDNLQKTKPLGHCLARAMQLLKTLPMSGQPGMSDICKARFLEQTTVSSSGIKTTISRSGIPGPGDNLASSPGMAATAQLFYDTIIIGTPKIIMGQQPKVPGQKSSVQQYIDFMKRMSVLFGDFGPDGRPKLDEVLQQEGLKGIKNRRDKDMCGDKIDKSVAIPANAVKSVYDIVNQLYQTQLKHSALCGQIFKMLFAIEREKSTGRYRISLNNAIIQKGFPEIDRINYIARDALVNYYEKCEQTYLQGMARVLSVNKAATAAATAAAMARAPGPAGRVASAPAAPGAPLRAPGLPGIMARPPVGAPIPATAAAAALGRK